MSDWEATMHAYHEAVEARDRALVEAVLGGESFAAAGAQAQTVRPPFGPLGKESAKRILLAFVRRRARKGEKIYRELMKVLPTVNRRGKPKVECDERMVRVSAIDQAREIWCRHWPELRAKERRERAEWVILRAKNYLRVDGFTAELCATLARKAARKKGVLDEFEAIISEPGFDWETFVEAR